MAWSFLDRNPGPANNVETTISDCYALVARSSIGKYDRQGRAPYGERLFSSLLTSIRRSPKENEACSGSLARVGATHECH